MRKIFLAVLVVLIISGGVYFYLNEKNKNDNLISLPPISGESNQKDTTPVADTKSPGLSDAQFLEAALDKKGKILARGDINGDGFEDAIVESVHCGASCGVDLVVVFNENNISAKVFDPGQSENFAPSYVSSSAAKSEIESISIKNGIISLTGKGLACTPPSSEEPCTEEKWNTEKTINYKFDGKSIVELPV